MNYTDKVRLAVDLLYDKLKFISGFVPFFVMSQIRFLIGEIVDGRARNENTIKNLINISFVALNIYAATLLPASPLQAIGIWIFVIIMSDVINWILTKIGPSTINHVVPTSGSISGGGWIDVYGTNFARGQDVMFGYVRALKTEFISSTKLRARVPPVLQLGDVWLGLNGHGYSSCQYKYVAPTITHVAPSSGSISGDGWIDVYGTNFARGQDVMFGYVRALKTVFISSTKLRARVPPVLQPGFVRLGLNGHGYSSCQYKYVAPTITHVAPSSGSISGGGWIDVYGTNFARGQDVMFGNVRAPKTVFISSSRLRAHVPPMPQPGFVQLGLNGHEYSSCRYEYVAPTIALVSPSSGSISGGGWTDVHGTNFAEGQEVMFGNVRALETEFISSTKLRAHVPPMPQPGFVQLGLNGHGYSSCRYEYVVPPRVTGWRLLPSGENGDITVIITGEGFREGEELLTGLGRTEFISSTELRFHLAPSSEPGSMRLSYGFKPLDSSFIPRVTGIVPASGSLAGGNLVTVFGEGFVEGHEVLIGGKVATVVAFGSDTGLVVRVPPSAVPGPVPVVIKGWEHVAGADPPKYTYEELPSQISAVSEELQQESHGDHPAGGAEKASEISAADDSTADDSARTRSQISAVSEELQQESHGDHPAPKSIEMPPRASQKRNRAGKYI